MNSQKVQDADQLRQTFIKKAERINNDQIKKSNMIRARNRFSGIFLALSVAGIYMYTLTAVKQEKFLDQIVDDPEPAKK